MKTSYMLDFEDVMIDVTSHFKKIDTNQYRTTGTTPIVDQSANDFCGYTDIQPDVTSTSPPYIIFGDHTRRFKFIDEDFVLGADGTKVLKTKIDADHKYLFHFFKSIKLEEAGYSRHYKFLKRKKLFIPPLAEQQHIAEQLDAADRILRLREQSIAKFDQLAQSVFAEMFGDLFVGRDDWQRTQLGKLRAEKRSLIDPSKYPNEVFTLYSIPAYDRNQQDILAGKDIGSAKQLVQTNDVLISKIVPHIRRAWIVGDEFTNRQIASGEWIVFASEQFKPTVLRYLFLSDAFHKRFMTTIAGVGGSLLRAQPRLVNKFEISVPPLLLQENFERFVIEQANHRTLLEKSQATFSALFSSLQSQSFVVN